MRKMRVGEPENSAENYSKPLRIEISVHIRMDCHRYENELITKSNFNNFHMLRIAHLMHANNLFYHNLLGCSWRGLLN